jgi:hypothetical protein
MLLGRPIPSTGSRHIRLCDAHGHNIGLAVLRGRSHADCHDAIAVRVLGDVLRAGIQGNTEARSLFANVIHPPVPRDADAAGQNTNARGRQAHHRIISNAVLRVVLRLTGANDTPATRARTPSSLTLVDVKTIHAGGPSYRATRLRSGRCGAVQHCAKAVDPEHRLKARKLDELPETRQHNGGSMSAVAGTLYALGKVRGLVFGQYGEASEDVHALLRAAVKAAALSDGRQQGAHPGVAPRLAALFSSQLRRAWRVAVVREMARNRLVCAQRGWPSQRRLARQQPLALLCLPLGGPSGFSAGIRQPQLELLRPSAQGSAAAPS